MNHLTIEQVEDALCLAYEQQAEKYERALRISEGLPDSFAQGTNRVDLLEQLRLTLDEIAGTNSQTQAARGQWDSLGRRPGARLRRALQRVEIPLKKLITVMASAEERARDARDRLSPKLNRESRGRQMRQAYASVIAQSSEPAGE